MPKTKPQSTEATPKTLYVVMPNATKVFAVEKFSFTGRIAYFASENSSEVHALHSDSAKPQYPAYFYTEVEADAYRVCLRKRILKERIKTHEKEIAFLQAEYTSLPSLPS